MSCNVESFLGVVEHKWGKTNELHCEINQAFRVNLFDLDSSQSPASRESHIEFYWVSINELDKHNLQPYPFRKLIKQLISGEDSVWWESTLDIEINTGNIV